MDDRKQRGRMIAETCRLTRKGSEWVVPSQSGNGKYTVRTAGPYPTCTCPDYQGWANKCKHLHAVEFATRLEENPDGTTTETRTLTVTETVTAPANRPTYKQDWPNYDKAQTREKDHFQELPADLCATIPEPPRRAGRRAGGPRSRSGIRCSWPSTRCTAGCPPGGSSATWGRPTNAGTCSGRSATRSSSRRWSGPT